MVPPPRPSASAGRSVPIAVSGVEERAGDLGVTIGFTAPHVVIGVRGGLDSVTAPDLEAALNAAADTVRADVVLDLGELDFIDASGLGVIVAAATRLRAAGGVLILRSTPPMALRILDITHVSDLVQFERSNTAPDRSGIVSSRRSEASSDVTRSLHS
jgi:anti-anti-sigma factor